jgi:hypothetical protein
MAASSTVHTKALSQLLDGTRPFVWAGVTDTIKCALFSSAANLPAARDTAQVFSDLSSEIAAGGGYTSGGVALTNRTATPSGHVVTCDADDASWGTSGIAGVRYAAIYKATGNASTSPLIAYVDLGSDQTVSALQWSTSGLFQLTAT